MENKDLKTELDIFTQMLEFNKKNRNIEPINCEKRSEKVKPQSWNDLTRV